MDESQGDRLSRKIKDAPFMPIGLAGFVGALGYGAYKYKHRGNMSTSFFLVQLRVASQGMVVGALCLGIIYTAGKKIYSHMSSSNEN